MKKIIILTISLLALSPLLSYSQAEAITYPYVEVRGNATKEIEPNRINVSVNLSEEATKGKVSMKELNIKFSTALKQCGIDVEQSVVLANQSSDAAKRNNTYQYKRYIVTCNTSNQVTTLFNHLNEAGIQTAQVVRIWHTDSKDLVQEVKMEALKSAQQTAQFLADGLGQKIGVAMQITDMNYYQPLGENTVMFKAYSTSNDNSSVEDETNKIKFKKIKIQQNITVKFLLIP